MVLKRKQTESRQAADERYRGNTLAGMAEWFVLLLFVAFHLYGVGVIQVGELSLAIWDILIVIFLICFLILSYIKTFYVEVFGLSKLLIISSFIFVTWTLFCALISPIPHRALTMVILQLLNIFVLFILIISVPINLAKLNTLLLWVGSGLAIIAIGLYLPAFSRYAQIVSNPDLWRPSVGYVLDQGGVLRLIGLAKDPNFYSLWMTPLLIVGLLRGRLSLLLGVIVLLSAGMALSRSFFVALLFASLILGVAMWRVRLLRRQSIKLIAVPLLMVFGILLVSQFWIDVEFIAKRISLAERTPRFERWQVLNHVLTEQWNPLTGAGLRSTELLLSGKYSHSTYLDALFETGIIGFVLWASILAISTFICFSRIKSADIEYIPWIYTWFVILVMFLSFSLLYHPFVWMVIGILMNGYRTRKPLYTHLHNPKQVHSVFRRVADGSH